MAAMDDVSRHELWGAAGTAAAGDRTRSANRRFVTGLARAFGGAIFFSLPLLMTMEMWWLGFYMNRLRLALFIVAFLPLLVGLTHFDGFEDTASWSSDIADALVACLVGFIASGLILVLLGVIDTSTPPSALLGKIALQAVPASMGASLAKSQLGGTTGRDEKKKRKAGYGGELFFMAAGAVFLAFNVAPTEEMILIAFKMTAWHAVALAVASIIMMHAFVYAAEFHGQEETPPHMPFWSVFLRFTVVGYAIALLLSAYVLWTFGRYDHASTGYMVKTSIVLGFPASLGAAAARLIF